MDKITTGQDLQDEIALKVFDGDESALADILKHYGLRLEKALLSKYVGFLRVEDVEEIVCDAVRKFWDVRQNYDDKKGSIRALLYKIADNTAKDVLRLGWQKARQLERSVDEEYLEQILRCDMHLNLIQKSGDSSHSEEHEKLMKAVTEVLKELPDIQRKILREDAMTEGDGVESAELGRRLGGIPSTTVRVYRSRAREAFRKGMNKRGFEI